MTPDMQWRDEPAEVDARSAPCESENPLLEAALIVLLFLPIVWVTLALVETFR